MNKSLKISLLLASFFSVTVYAADLTTAKIDVISFTPLEGIGLSSDRIPSSIQNIQSKDLKAQQSTTIADFMNTNLLGVSATDTQNNPYQPDITYRGYSVSPIQGGQTGMSVYIDGVRVNDAFGDGVSWDLIPTNSIKGVSLMPGSNPIFGYNTLGGALSIQTKSGRTNPGLKAEVSAGSWGRKVESAEFGEVSKDGAIDYFVSANVFNEDGWRKNSDSAVRQVFSKLGWENKTTKLNLSFTGANTDLTGNGLMPLDMMSTLGREAIFTKPDITRNDYGLLNLSGTHWFSEKTMLSGNAYYKWNERQTHNGDANDGWDTAQDAGGDVNTNLGLCRSTSSDSDEHCNGTTTKTKTRQKTIGLSGQLTINNDLFSKPNQLIVGAGYEKANVHFNRNFWYGILTDDRGVEDIRESVTSNKVDMKTFSHTSSIFVSDNLEINDQLNLTVAGRYNYTTMDLRDYWVKRLSAANQKYNVDGDHTYARFNPSIGLNFNPSKTLSTYASYSENARTATALELSCANPNAACKYPNQMASDPHLKQVVAKTYEIGGQTLFANNLKLNVSAYRSENNNDIQFVFATGSLGYFDNVGKTRRIGLDSSLSGSYNNFNWTAGYSYVDATYQSDLTLPNQVNSSRTGAGDNQVISVTKGDYLPNIPKHQFKLRLDYNILPSWNVGTNISVFSDRFMMGNENNEHVDSGVIKGKTPGYTVVNLDTNYQIASGWSLFGKINNLFDKDYTNGGRMGQSILNSSGTTASDDHNVSFVAPGAPRAGWIGVRYEFGSTDKKD